MDKYEIKASIEPKDNYEKAKWDILKAMESINKLSPQDRQKLAIEIFGIEKYQFALSILQNGMM